MTNTKPNTKRTIDERQEIDVARARAGETPLRDSPPQVRRMNELHPFALVLIGVIVFGGPAMALIGLAFSLF